MKLLLTKEEIEAVKHDCGTAYAASLTAEGDERLRLRHKSFPYYYRCTTEDQHLRVCIDQHGMIAISDLGGFLTFVETSDELVEILTAEANDPGALRELLTGKNNLKAARERQEQRQKEIVTDLPTLDINLDDLELTI